MQYSLIIPQRDRADDVCRQIGSISDVLRQCGSSHEIIVVDDGSKAAAVSMLESSLRQWPALRVLRLERRSGTSVALAAGIAAARGQVVVALDPAGCYPLGQIPALVSRLSRADMVVGRRQLTGLQKMLHRLTRLPRWLLLGLEVHDPECLFWAARREAVAGVQLTQGMARYLPTLVVRRGFRVCETYVDHRGAFHRLQDVPPNPFDLLAAWWLCRRWRETDACEMTPAEGRQLQLRLVDGEAVSNHDSLTAPSYPSVHSQQARRA